MCARGRAAGAVLARVGVCAVAHAGYESPATDSRLPARPAPALGSRLARLSTPRLSAPGSRLPALDSRLAPTLDSRLPTPDSRGAESGDRADVTFLTGATRTIGPRPRASAQHHGAVPPAPDDDELELIRRSGVVLRVGRLSLSAGTGSYRVKASMARVARALGIDRHEAHVTLTEITTTSHRGPSFRTEVTEVRIDRRQRRPARRARAPGGPRRRAPGDGDASRRSRPSSTASPSKPPLYPVLLNALWAAIACAAFSFLNNGGVVEVVGVFVGAYLGQALRRTMLHRGFNQFGVTMLAATVACLGYLGFVSAAAGGGRRRAAARGRVRLGRAVPRPGVPAGHRLPRPGQAGLLGGRSRG